MTQNISEQKNAEKQEIISKLSDCINNIEESDLKDIKGDVNSLNNTPDLYSFFSELTALKQEIKLKNKIEQKTSTGMTDSLNQIDTKLTEICSKTDDIIPGSNNLAKKQEIAENKIILELIKLREMIVINAAYGTEEKTHVLPAKLEIELRHVPKSKNNNNKYINKLIKIFEKQMMVIRDLLRNLKLLRRQIKKLIKESDCYKSEKNLFLAKIDDVLRRYNVDILVETGDIFDSRIMEVIEIASNKKLKSGTVVKVFQHTYIRNKTTLQLAEVKVVK
jgi:molecular chaperone GrpE (heat shock protein)